MAPSAGRGVKRRRGQAALRPPLPNLPNDRPPRDSFPRPLPIQDSEEPLFPRVPAHSAPLLLRPERPEAHHQQLPAAITQSHVWIVEAQKYRTQILRSRRADCVVHYLLFVSVKVDITPLSLP